MVEHLEQVGIHTKQAQKLLSVYGEQRILAVIYYAQRRQTHNIGGFIVQALKQNWKIH